MSIPRNFQVRLATRPEGLPDSRHWEMGSTDIVEPSEGEVLVETAFISVDPAMRGWLRDAQSYLPPVAIGDVMRAGGVGTVVASRHPGFAEGDPVVGHTGVQSHACLNGDGLRKVSTTLAPLSTFLGALGMPGMTAYFGVTDVGALEEGDTLLVSSAAGAVGSMAGQIARNRGAERVVGIAGGEEKCRYVVEDLGFDAAIDYKAEAVGEKILEHCPEGVDVYFDNVGGEILDAALPHLRRGARVVLCGAISQYNHLDDVRGPRNYLSLLVHRARMQGFIVTDYVDQYPRAMKEMAAWLTKGRLVNRETIVRGLESFPETFQRLFRGDTIGKLLIEV